MSANFIDLTTVAAVNNLLAQTAGTDAAIIQTEITNLSRYILNRTSRGYLGGFLNYTETYNGNGSETLMLRNYPVLSVSALSVNGTSIPQSSSTSQSGWVIDTSGSQSAILLRGGGAYSYTGYSRWSVAPNWGGYGNAPPLGQSPFVFYEGAQNVAISYTAGQVTTQYNESVSVPASPGPYTVTVAQAATFWQDQGATLTNGTPVTGYTVANGIYTFPSSYQGQAVLITYQYGAVPQDLNEAATKIVATYYRRPKYLDQVSQMQPGIGTTAFSRAEWAPECLGIIGLYKRVFQD